MCAQHAASAMDQKIFNLGLAVETISAYLLCCALANEGRSVTRPDLLRVWSATPETLDRALAELCRHAILAPAETDGNWRLLPSGAWRKA